MRRVPLIRLVLALLGVCLLACGVWLNLPWLAGAGLAGLVLAELAGQAALRVAASSPALRLAEAAGETLPSIGVALVLPQAMLVAAAIAVRPLVCGAIETVKVSRGNAATRTGRGLRRTLTAGANLLLVAAAASSLGLAALGSAEARPLLWAAVAAACAASAGAITRDAFELRRR